MNAHTPFRHMKNATMGDTLKAMRQLAFQARADLEIRALVEKLCSQVAEGDYASETLAIYYWVTQNVRYMRDPDALEMVKDPRQTLKTRSGDCDDIATLLAAMFLASGNPVRFAIASFRSGMPVFSHVYVEVVTPHGPVVFDPVANRDTKKMLREMKAKQVFPVSQGPGTTDAGIGTVGRSPHVGNSGGNLYSVFDYTDGQYRYFESPLRGIPATGRYRAPRTVTQFGSAPEEIAAIVPTGSKEVGRGEIPRGMIAVFPTGVGLAAWQNASPSLKLGVAFVAGVLVSRFWKNRK